MVTRMVGTAMRRMVGVALVVALMGGAGAAWAGPGAEKTLGGKVLVSDKKFPTYAKSVGAYVAALRKQSKATLTEDKVKHGWKVYIAAFFKRPVNDIEIVVKLYDVSNRGRTLMTSFEQFLDQRGQQALLSDFTLDRKLVGVNKDVLLTIEVGGAVVATGKFKITGEAERLTGKAAFSDEDTKGDGDE